MKLRVGILAGLAFLLALPVALAAQDVPPPKGTVLDEIIARVNDEIITSHQYKEAQATLRQEIKQDCPSCTPAQLETEYQKEVKDLLSNMIDQDLLVQRAKDEGIDVDADVIKQLDQVRQHYKLDSLEALRRAVEASGMNWDDYKDSIKRQFLAQKLIQQDVGGTVQIGHNEIEKYYEEHKTEFNRPETVVIREIFLSTKDKTPEQIAAIKKQAENIRQRLLNGEDFAQLAKLFSQGPTAQQGGELGSFTRGQLAKPIEDAVFKLQHNQLSPVIEMPTGFDILQVEQHYQAGIQPLDKVEQDIENAIYQVKIRPAMTHFLQVLRQQSYIKLKPGYVDTSAVAETPIEEVTPGTDDSSGKKGKKKTKGRE